MSLGKWKAFGVALACLAAVAAGVAAFKGGCPACIETVTGGCAHMKCFYAFHAVCLVEALAAAAALGLAFVKCKIGRRWLAAVCILAQACALAAMYTPLGGLCASSEMVCHSTAAIVDVLALVLCVGCIIAMVFADPARANRPKRGL